MAEAHDVLVRGGVEDQGVDRQQGVEPAAGLVDGLGDEVGREAERLGRARHVRVAHLGRRHGARVEPGVDHRLDAVGQRAVGALRAGEGDLVDGRAVGVDVVDVTTAQLAELVAGPDAGQVVRLAAPDRQGRAPEAVARQSPVDVVLQPLAEAAVADVPRVPVDPLVLLDHPRGDLRGGDVPRGLAPVDEHGLAAPAVRQGVGVVHALEQGALVLEGVVDLRVALAHRPAGQPGNVVGELAVGTHRVERDQPVLAAHLAVDLAEGGSEVHQAGAVVGGDEVGAHHDVGGGSGWQRDVIEGADIGQPDERAARDPVGDDGVLPHHRLDEVLGHDRAVDDAVGQHRVGGHPGVRQQRPGRRRPDGERRGVTDDGRIRVDQGEAHEGRLVELVLVDAGLGQLVARECGATARAVGDDLEVLVEQASVEDLLELPPDALDVLGGEGPVGGVEVRPVADALGEGPPVVDVAEHGLLAEPGELGDSDLVLDLLLARDPEALLHLDLDREAVGVPSGAALDEVAAHGLEATEEILVGPSPDVVEAGLAVGGGWSLVEDPRGGVGPVGHRALEDLVLGPAGLLVGLDGDEVDLRADRAEQRRLLGRGDTRSYRSVAAPPCTSPSVITHGPLGLGYRS